MDVQVEEPGGSNIHNNAFFAEETLLKSEMQAMRDCNPLAARHWIVRHSYPPHCRVASDTSSLPR